MQLAAGLRGRDPRALAALYEQHAPLVHGLALRMLMDAAAAEEVTQDVFLYVWQQAARFDATRGSLAAWLVTLARSRSIDRLRARASQARRIEGLARTTTSELPPATGALDGMLAQERQGRVRSALAMLPAEQRQALEIAYFEGLSHTEIAARLGAPLGTVKTRIRQGMLRLRAALGDDPA
jgi:RNA polymerase sigma-70 factor (ECF subfamily)